MIADDTRWRQWCWQDVFTGTVRSGQVSARVIRGNGRHRIYGTRASL